MELVTPSVKYQESYLQALEEAKDKTETTVLPQPAPQQSFEEFVKNAIEESQGLHLPSGWVPATTFWLIDNNEFIGWVNIRHILTDYLLRIGGHIGYWIRPSKRKMGYGKKILELALPKAKELGVTKALLTCDDTNIGSQRIIEANGGILENIIDNGVGNPKKRRYWIQLA